MNGKFLMRTMCLAVLFVMGISTLAPPSQAAFELPEIANDGRLQIESGMNTIETESDSGPAYLVKDIHPSGDPYIEDLTDVNGTLYFSADDSFHGRELWKSDGTESGTGMVKDIHPSAGSNPGNLISVNDFLFFSANDGIHGIELWKSNGTEGGTVMVKDINPGIGHSGSGGFHYVAGTLYFSADDSVHGRELWKTDGTESGTVMIKDINPSGSSVSWISKNIDGTLYFVADDGIHGLELWKSDGTEMSTVMVKDINPSGDSFASPVSSTSVAGSFFLRADDGVHGSELWMSDGTASGTKMVKDIRPGAEGSYWVPGFYLVSDDKLFFPANDGTHGNELWISDGTEAGTELVKDTDPSYGGIDCMYGCIHSIINGLLFFEVYTQNDGFELWVSDGTEPGTRMVKDINPGPGSGRDCSLNCSWATIDGILYFAATDGTNGRELWRSDGTEAGTVMVKNINAFGPDDVSRSGPKHFTEVNNVFFFTADDGIHGEELWRSDGTETGTNMVQDIFSGTSGSEPWNLLVSGQRLFFVADDGVHGMELWALPLGLMTGLSLSGATEGEIGIDYSFNADVSPPEAGTPVTYDWQATDKGSFIHSAGLTDSIKFSWDTPGIKIISVTVNNGVSELHGQVEININEEKRRIFIPILVSNPLP